MSITVPAGEWRFAASQSLRTLGYAGELHLDTYHENPALKIYAQNLPTLEERLGFAIPSTARILLDRSPRQPFFTSPRQIVGLHEVPRNATLRPTRSSIIRLDGQPNSTYGAAMEKDHPLYSWREDDVRIEIVAARHARPNQGRDAVSYRIWYQGTVMFSGTDVHLPADVNPRSAAAVKAVASGLDGVWGGDHLTERQYEFLLKHGREVVDAVNASTRTLSTDITGLSDLTPSSADPGPQDHAAPIPQAADIDLGPGL
ncbi:hypothetical protein [Frankia sp. EAN1pec]|uniref:hypothetical protein n=1 Tax=Parafrankia sp. (strain EAN1pec) TaxID=298653 RepID=UPI0002DFDDD1